MPFLIKYSPEIVAFIFICGVLAYAHHETVVNTENSIAAKATKVENKVEESNDEIRNSVNDLSTTYVSMLHDRF